MRFSSVKRLAASLLLLVFFAAGCRYIDASGKVVAEATGETAEHLVK